MGIFVLADFKTWAEILDTEHDASLGKVLLQAESIFKRYLNSPIKAEDITETFYISKQRASFLTYNRPINSITSLKNLLSNTIYDPTDDFGIDYKTVIFKYQGFFPAGKYELVYNAGWDEIPEALEYGVYSLAIWIWQRGDPGAIYQTEALIPENIKEILRQFGGLL